MGSIHKLLKNIEKTRRTINELLKNHIQDLDKIRAIIKYNQPIKNYCPNCGGRL